MTSPDLKRAAREAHAHATSREQQLLGWYPRAWEQLDQLRSHPPAPWPDWCLLEVAVDGFYGACAVFVECGCVWRG